MWRWARVVLTGRAGVPRPTPWGLAHYDTVLGGGPRAVNNVLVGWSEGVERAGAFIAERERGHRADVTVRAPWIPQAYSCGRLSGAHDTTYAIVYIDVVQRLPDQRTKAADGRTLVATIEERGIPYAWAYGPRRTGQLTGAHTGMMTLLPPAEPSGARADGRELGGRQQSAGSVLDRHEAQVVPEFVRASELPVGQLPEEFDHCRAGAHGLGGRQEVGPALRSAGEGATDVVDDLDPGDTER